MLIPVCNHQSKMVIEKSEMLPFIKIPTNKIFTTTFLNVFNGEQASQSLEMY